MNKKSKILLIISFLFSLTSLVLVLAKHNGITFPEKNTISSVEFSEKEQLLINLLKKDSNTGVEAFSYHVDHKKFPKMNLYLRTVHNGQVKDRWLSGGDGRTEDKGEFSFSFSPEKGGLLYQDALTGIIEPCNIPKGYSNVSLAPFITEKENISEKNNRKVLLTYIYMPEDAKEQASIVYDHNEALDKGEKYFGENSYVVMLYVKFE